MIAQKVHHIPARLMIIANAIVLLSYSLGIANISVKREGEGEGKPLQSIVVDESVYASINGLCEAIGGATRWNKSSHKLTCVKGDRKVVFSGEIPFCHVNDTLTQLPCAPVFQEGALYLPAWILVSTLSSFDKEPMEWNDADSAIVIGGAAAVRQEATEKTVPTHVTYKESPVEGNSEEPEEGRQFIKTIVIDPGHGGKDPGAIGPGGSKEKDVVLSIGLKLRDKLKKKSGFRFI